MAQLVKCLTTKAGEPEFKSQSQRKKSGMEMVLAIHLGEGSLEFCGHLGSLLKLVRFPSTTEKKTQTGGRYPNKQRQCLTSNHMHEHTQFPRQLNGADAPAFILSQEWRGPCVK